MLHVGAASLLVGQRAADEIHQMLTAAALLAHGSSDRVLRGRFDVAIDAAGRLSVTDGQNHRVRRWPS